MRSDCGGLRRLYCSDLQRELAWPRQANFGLRLARGMLKVEAMAMVAKSQKRSDVEDIFAVWVVLIRREEKGTVVRDDIPSELCFTCFVACWDWDTS